VAVRVRISQRICSACDRRTEQTPDDISNSVPSGKGTATQLRAMGSLFDGRGVAKRRKQGLALLGNVHAAGTTPAAAITGDHFYAAHVSVSKDGAATRSKLFIGGGLRWRLPCPRGVNLGRDLAWPGVPRDEPRGFRFSERRDGG